MSTNARIRYMFELFAIILIFLAGCSAPKQCPGCGENIEDVNHCSACGAAVCDWCGSEERYMEEIYSSGEMIEYLEDNGYVVLDSYNDAWKLYTYGFLTGYQKGRDNIWDKEVKESMSYDYDILSDRYEGYRP